MKGILSLRSSKRALVNIGKPAACRRSKEERQPPQGEKKQIDRSIDRMFFVVLMLVPIISVPWHEGISGCDSPSYVYSAKKFLETHSINYNDPIETRVIAWIPYAIYIFFFGINKYITWVTTIELCALLCIIYFFLRNQDQVVALYSSAIIGLSTFMIQISAVVRGDTLLTLLVNLPLLVYWRYIKNEISPKASQWGIFAGVCWVLAFYTKEVAVYYLIVCLYFSVIAYSKKYSNDIKFWSSFWTTLIFAGIFTVGYFYFQTGDPFRKITLANEVVTHYDQARNAPGELLYRVTLQPIIFFIQNYTLGLLVLLSLFYLIPFRKSENGFWIGYSIVALSVWWIVPQNISPYHPIWLINRLWMPIVVPLSICAGYGMKSFVACRETKSGRWAVILTGISFVIVSYKMFLLNEDALYKERAVFYSIITLFILLALYVKENVIIPNLRKVALVVVLFPFFYQCYDRFSWKDYRSEYDYTVELVNTLEKRADAHTVLSTYCVAQFYKIHGAGKLTFVRYEDAKLIGDNLSGYYLVIDKNLIDAKYNLKESDDFTGMISVLHAIETSPFEFGFTLLEENEKYQIYHHQ